MKQLLFLLLFPCLALAQYTGNAGQKITLGEQTTADGLIWRGVASDTTRKPSVDTMAYILLDTNTNIIWQYKSAVSNAWTRVGGSISSGVTGTLPVANGGTGASTFTAGSVVFAGTSGTYTQDNSGLFYDSTNDRLGIGTTSPFYKLHIASNYSKSTSSPSGPTQFTISTNETLANNPFGFNIRIYGGASAATRYAVFQTGEDGLSNSGNFTMQPFGGNVGIGTTAPLALLNVIGTVRINSASAPDANYYLQLENSASQKAKANAWDTYSDKRIKTDIQPIYNAINKVNLLNPVYYQKHDSYVENDFLNIDYDSSVKSLGFIAQEVYNIIPEAVNTGTTNELWAMDYTKIIPILTKAIQEQQALIKALEQRILILENK